MGENKKNIFNYEVPAFIKTITYKKGGLL